MGGFVEAFVKFVKVLPTAVMKLSDVGATGLGEMAGGTVKNVGDVVEKAGEATGVKELENVGRTTSDIGQDPRAKKLLGTAAMIAATAGVASAAGDLAGGTETLGGVGETLGSQALTNAEGSRQITDVSQAAEGLTDEQLAAREAEAARAAGENVTPPAEGTGGPPPEGTAGPEGSRQTVPEDILKEQAAQGLSTADMVNAVVQAGAGAASLLQKPPDIPPVDLSGYKLPDNWNTMSKEEQSAWLVRGGEAAKKRPGRIAGDVGQIRGGVSDAALGKGLLTGTTQAGQKTLLGA